MLATASIVEAQTKLGSTGSSTCFVVLIVPPMPFLHGVACHLSRVRRKVASSYNLCVSLSMR